MPGLPRCARSVEVRVLIRTFARAFGVEPPSLARQDAEQVLATFVAFTAACIELALEDRRVAAVLRARLGAEAEALGGRIRMGMPLPSGIATSLARLLYRGIGIDLVGDLPGDLRFRSCVFARRYTPQDCWFMSAFDEGFMRGLTGLPDASLAFSRRLTEGATCCCARFCNARIAADAFNDSERMCP